MPGAALTRRVRGWRPTQRQRAYLAAHLDPNTPKTISGLAERIGVTRSAIQQWMHTDQFVAWFNAEVQAVTEHYWNPALLRTMQLAGQGSVEHMRLMAQIRGLRLGGETSGQQAGVTVIVGIPRAGDVVAIPEHAVPALPPPPSIEQH